MKQENREDLSLGLSVLPSLHVASSSSSSRASPHISSTARCSRANSLLLFAIFKSLSTCATVETMAGLSRAVALILLGAAVRASPCKLHAATILDLSSKAMLTSIFVTQLPLMARSLNLRRPLLRHRIPFRMLYAVP